MFGSLANLPTGFDSIWGVVIAAQSVAEVETPPEVHISFSIIRLLVLIVWFYLCLYSVQRLEFGPLVLDQYKKLTNIFGLVIGPFILFTLSIADIARKLQRGQIELKDVPKALFGIVIKDTPVVKVQRTIELLDASGKSFYEVFGSAQNKSASSDTIELAEQTILNALDNRASDLLIDPKDQDEYTVRLRIDGRLRVASEISLQQAIAMINSIKSISGMDISEKRRPQDGAFQARLSDGNAHFRVATAGVLGGEKIAIRILDQSSGLRGLKEVGFSGSNIKRIEDIIDQPSGMVLVCGPTGSGKTTTLYAMLDSMDRFTRNIVTVEDPIEHVMPQTSQIEVNAKADITFASTLRSILRQDPDVICVGEIRDGETAGMAVQASHTGHLLLSTLHSTSNMASIIRLMDLGVKPLLLASSLSVIISQRLIRRLCDNCKVPAELTDKEVDSFKTRHIDPGSIYQPIGCKRCEGTGFFGRIAIIDVTYMDEELKANLTNQHLSVADFKKKGDTSARHNLKREGMRKVLAGLTTFDEVKRVISNLG